MESTAKSLVLDLVASLTRRVSPGWLEMDCEFAWAANSRFLKITFNYPDKTIRVEPSAAEIELLRRQRSATAISDTGPWWRMLLLVTASGEVDFSYDYGEDPFPDDQLFPAEDYRADLQEHPQKKIPLWMNAYINHGDRQLRSPQQAVAEARRNRNLSRWPQLAVNELPDFPDMWSRWAVISAAFVAYGSDWGPRILPGCAWFESSRRSGCTLYPLPGGRGVLSGGVWDAPSLDSAYASGSLPDLFRGAPEWVATPVLNHRSAAGLLTFCYWWEGGHWYRGDSPPASELATAIPGLWTRNTVSKIVSGLADPECPTNVEQATADLVSAVEQGCATRDAFVRVFRDAHSRDIDSALYQLSTAGVQYSFAPERIPKDLAASRARKYFESQSDATADVSATDELTAERLGTGWRFYAPASAKGATQVEEAVYVDDDGDGFFVEPTEVRSPARVVAAFESRFRSRHAPGDVPPAGPGPVS
ncbi:hypothetical protein [Streptomyces sp. NBC_01637]|uniref:hypothetical protein n=1 Tax=unclassified Streptomyces TaxID=2593676 RepID=UPI0038688E07|nr:hypothetical protein OH719_06250 [Streptomyces sp. NBC_01653]WTD37965.1 hypothetical protein OHB03_40680 [Streptomyces sp. NBC_01643]WTD93323.1 hypothetical protein OG891_40610 [Streptomyces sp. NBC_01637]